MIEINLIPIEMRKKRSKATLFEQALHIPKEALLGIGGGLLVLLLTVHIILGIVLVTKWIQYKNDEKVWNTMASDKKVMDSVLNELRILQNEVKSVQSIVTEDRISWAKKLNEISDSMPKGAWLSKVYVDDKGMTIEGSAFSKASDAMISVGNLAANLKSSEHFMKRLANVEVGIIKRRNVGALELADFSILAKFK